MINFKDRSRKQMIDFIPWGTKSHHKKLKSTIYHTFRIKILPFLPVDVLSRHFSTEKGRPTKDLQSMLGLFIIQALKDMTDEEAIEAFCFNDAFKYALDISRDEYLSERSYYYYRAKLLGEENIIFDAVLRTIADRLNLDTAIQREDSTMVRTWLKNMSKLELFSTTIKKCLKDIKDSHPIIFSRISENIRNKYLPENDEKNWFASNKPSEYKKCLIDAAHDVLSLLEGFETHPKVSKLDSFLLLRRLADEQITQDGEDITVKVKAESKGTAMTNPHDPDAHFNGHKKTVGYKADFTETCSSDKDSPNPKIVTNVEVLKANVPDSKLVQTTVDKLERKGMKPDTMLGDNGFDSDENQQNLKKKGVDLVCPPSGDLPDGFGVMDFEIAENGKELTKCPLGKACLNNKISTKQQSTTSYFDREICANCPQSKDCPIKITKRKARVVWKWSKPRIEARRRMFKEDEATKALYRQRAGGEAAFSLSKRILGLERTRRRGFTKNKMVIVLAATALNVLRMYNWLIIPDNLRQFSMNKHFFMPNFSFIWKILRGKYKFIQAC